MPPLEIYMIQLRFYHSGERVVKAGEGGENKSLPAQEFIFIRGEKSRLYMKIGGAWER